MNQEKLNKYIAKANEIHNNFYDYSKCNPNRTRDTTTIICPLHGEFYTSLDNHISHKTKCPQCQGVKKYTTESFIEKCQSIYVDEDFDYSKVNYINAKTNVIIHCNHKFTSGNIHGDFEILPKHFLEGRGCPYCKGSKTTVVEQIQEAMKVHNNKYDYTLWRNVKKNSDTVSIICHCNDENGKEHGVFQQTLESHLNGSGCPKCNGGVRFTNDEFQQKLASKYNGKISTNDTYVNANTSLTFYCHELDEDGNEHGEFKQTPYQLINRGVKCPKCSPHAHHKEANYWNNKERCEEVAKLCFNKYEFQTKYCSAYRNAKKNNWLDEFTEKYFHNEINYKGYHEKIHCVYVYQFDNEKVCYVGRTNNISRRDRQHRNGYLHSNGKREYDSLHKFCTENNIEMVKPIILEEGLNALESQIKEDSWLQQYKQDGWNTLNKAATGANIGSLGSGLKWTYDACLEESKKYKSKSEMKKMNQSAYNASVQNNWINDFFESLKKENGFWDNLDRCKEEASKYKNWKMLAIKCGSCYNAIKRNGWKDAITFKKQEKDS